MNKKFGKFLFITLIIYTLFLPSVLSVTGEEPIIASRISEISEISVIHDSDYNKPNTTLFGINVTVEILNKDAENQTVTESADYYPKVFIKASLENQSLEFEGIGLAHATIMRYTYQPGITVEYDYIMFYINQTDLAQLPDGNYTLGRPINTASQWLNITAGEVLLTTIKVTSGEVNITYMDFDYHPTEETSFSLIFPIVFLSLFSFMIFVYIRRTSIWEEKKE